MVVKLFITGGAGFVGSHCIAELFNSKDGNGNEINFHIVVVDNMINSVNGKNGKPISLERVEKLTGRSVEFHQVDLQDKDKLGQVFKSSGPFDCVIHFAALKAVGESWKSPLKYYQNNIVGSLNLLQVMSDNGCKRLVFSSSSTVYGNPQFLPVTEEHPRGNCTNPYGRTKYMMEEMMRDLCNSDPEWKAIMLRYFNPLGAHPSGELGEDPKQPRNLTPFIAKALKGEIPHLSIFGNDYPTKDGTGVRDYTHIMDIAEGHVAAVEKIIGGGKQDGAKKWSGWTAYNFGQGEGNSVLEVVQAFENASGLKVPYKFVERRRGDIAKTFADHGKAERELGWSAKRSLEQMCIDSWRWQEKNPDGYGAQK